jgi:pilus assembly protein CpaF
MAQTAKVDPRKLLREWHEKARRIRELKLRVVRKVLGAIDQKILHPEKDNSEEAQKSLEQLEKSIQPVIESLGMPEEAARRLKAEIQEHLLNFGILSDFILDPAIRRIMVNSRSSIFVEENEVMTLTNREFPTNLHLARIIQRIIRLGGGRISPENPIADISLDEGLWVTAALPPVAAPGPVLAIQKSGGQEYTLDELVEQGSMSRSISQFLQACLEGKRNIIVSGMTGSGRTTLLNAMLNQIPAEERIVVIDDRGELATTHPNCVFLRPRRSLTRGIEELNAELMLRTAQRLRPDRLILGDCRGDETLELLQAMSSGHKGCLTTCHASSPADLTSRLETLVLLSQETLSPKAVKNLIFSSIDLVIHIERLNDRSRRITHITELTGMEGEIITRSDIYRFRNLGTNSAGAIEGIFEPTGIVPKFFQELKQMGVAIPKEIF